MHKKIRSEFLAADIEDLLLREEELHAVAVFHGPAAEPNISLLFMETAEEARQYYRSLPARYACGAACFTDGRYQEGSELRWYRTLLTVHLVGKIPPLQTLVYR